MKREDGLTAVCLNFDFRRRCFLNYSYSAHIWGKFSAGSAMSCMGSKV